MMNTLLKNLGVIILLVGVVIIAIPTITETPNNAYLGFGLFTVVLGFVAHIFLNKKFE